MYREKKGLETSFHFTRGKISLNSCGRVGFLRYHLPAVEQHRGQHSRGLQEDFLGHANGKGKGLSW